MLLIVLTVLVIACNTTVEENPTATNIEKEITTKIAIIPKIVKINPDSLIVIPSKGKVVKAGIPKIVPYTGIRPIEAGTPKVVVIDKTNLKVFTPGEDGIPLPEKYTIQKQPATTDYSI